MCDPYQRRSKEHLAHKFSNSKFTACIVKALLKIEEIKKERK